LDTRKAGPLDSQAEGMDLQVQRDIDPVSQLHYQATLPSIDKPNPDPRVT
jgi:hypothetical protein